MLTIDQANLIRTLEAAREGETPMDELIVPGTKMSKELRTLTPRARAFVLALVELGGSHMDRAAQVAGYQGDKRSLQVTASRLAADPRVQEALVAEAKALARSSSLLAVAETVTIMTDAGSSKRDRLTAAGRIMALAGLEPEKNVNLHHTVEVTPTTREQIDTIIKLAQDTGMDPRKLLGRAGVVLDAEFTVTNDATGLEDLL